MRLGRAIVLALAERGARVAFTHLGSGDAARELADSLGDRALTLRCDVSHEDEVEALFATLDERLGPLDLLVNSAAIFERGPVLETDAQQWRRCRCARPGSTSATACNSTASAAPRASTDATR